METIKKIKQRLFHGEAPLSERELKVLQHDHRKGVQQLLSKWRKQQEKQALLKQKYAEMSTYEQQLWQQGKARIAGVDEAGRGPLAGPVVAAAVILKKDTPVLGLNDSKQLTEKMREELYQEITASAEAVGVGTVSAKEIDRLNIYRAAGQAMIKAVRELKAVPDHLLIDAMRLPVSMPQTPIIKGDSRSVSIAAGSIVAKVTRDRLMREMDAKYPNYGFARNFGYATAEHLQSLERHGVCEEHRRSFAPVRERVI
ncbi:MAG TPA: ribonuclease HII [Bacillales bacterium]|nr:ribonuclease HII [Bacillales bacterium]